MKGTDYFGVRYTDDYQFEYLRQTLLPQTEVTVITDNYENIAEAIERLEIRGAPAIGIAAAFGLALSIKRGGDETNFYSAYNRLASTRPTAVNLFWALEKMKTAYHTTIGGCRFEDLWREAVTLFTDDVYRCEQIGRLGSGLITKKSVALTHCNTGKLVTAGNGTALNVIVRSFAEGNIEHVYVDETRPLFQGARLTAYELEKNGIPFSIITDSTAGTLMGRRKIDFVITGADRIAANGDTANKIGTYSLAVLARFHSIPFFVAAPESTFDRSLESGEHIPIEERSGDELRKFRGVEITNANYPTYTPAFDVTPGDLITAIITDKSVYNPPYKFK